MPGDQITPAIWNLTSHYKYFKSSPSSFLFFTIHQQSFIVQHPLFNVLFSIYIRYSEKKVYGMSNTLSTMDRELLGEVIDGGEANLAKAHGGPRDGAFEGSNGATFTPLNATAGTLIKVSSKGDVLEPGSVSVSVVAHLTHTLPAIFCCFTTRSIPSTNTLYHMWYSSRCSHSVISFDPSHHLILQQASWCLKLGTPQAVNRISGSPIHSSLHPNISINISYLHVPPLINQGFSGNCHWGHQSCPQDT